MGDDNSTLWGFKNLSRPAFLALLQPCLAGVPTATNEKCVDVHLDDEGVEIVRPRYQDPPVLAQI